MRMPSSPHLLALASVVLAGCFTPYSWGGRPPEPQQVRTRSRAALYNAISIAGGAAAGAGGLALIVDGHRRDSSSFCCNGEEIAGGVISTAGLAFVGGGLIGLLLNAFELEPVTQR